MHIYAFLTQFSSHVAQCHLLHAMATMKTVLIPLAVWLQVCDARFFSKRQAACSFSHNAHMHTAGICTHWCSRVITAMQTATRLTICCVCSQRRLSLNLAGEMEKSVCTQTACSNSSSLHQGASKHIQSQLAAARNRPAAAQGCPRCITG